MEGQNDGAIPHSVTEAKGDPVYTSGTALAIEDQSSMADHPALPIGRSSEQLKATHTQPLPRVQSPYYIVFSVTAIERSNVKNPIIRFDAKVITTFPVLITANL